MFTYVGNNPANHMDPDGLIPLPDGMPGKSVGIPVPGSKGKAGILIPDPGFKPSPGYLQQAKNEFERRKKAGAKPLSPKSYDPTYNCFGATFADDLGGKKYYLEEFQPILSAKYRPMVKGETVGKNDVLLISEKGFKDGKYKYQHSMRVVGIDSSKNKVYESKDVAGGFYQGTASQVGVPELYPAELYDYEWWRRR